jgi:streptomycin 3"-adenylyltransferase
VIRERGLTLWGTPIADVFGPVPDEDYLDAILYDVDEARDTMADSPVSTILNLCRALAFVEDKACFSKQEGGRWALAHLPEQMHPLITEALRCYEAGETMILNADAGLDFAEEMLRLIHGKTA